jgi:hypothetical protein
MKGFKARIGKSPDEFDSCIILVEHCRMQGAEPGSGSQAPRALAAASVESREVDAMYDESSYTQPEDWAAYANA